MLKFLTEFGPLGVFFIGYSNNGILTATLYMLIASIIGIVITYITERKINLVNIISSGLLLISASLTLFSGNSIFIKMKPTVLYIIFAGIFLVTNFKWQPAIKFVLGKAISLKEESKWRDLNIRFMFFFIIMAVMNEVVWRNFSEETWVNFKVFGALPVTILFMVTQMPFIMRNKVEV
ncbi:MAG: septation protein A [Rickettsiaceae bacterium]